jgi:hypothetical protein
MPCIRRHYNYGIIYLKPELIGKFKMCGQTVDVVTHTDDFKRIRFAGFLDIADIPPQAKRVKLVNISGYSHESTELGPWVDYGRNVTMLGAYFDGVVWLVLDAGLPIAWCELKPPPLDN